MSRIPAPGAIVATTTISAVLAICMLGGVGTAAPAGDSVAPVSTVISAIGAVRATNLAGADDVVSVGSAPVAPATELGTGVALVDASGAISSPGPTAAFGLAAGGVAAQVVAPTQVVAPVQIAAPAQVVAPAPLTTVTTVVAAPALVTAVHAAVPAARVTASVAAPATVRAQPKAVVPPLVAGTPRQIANTIAVAKGLNGQQWSCLDQLWQRESKFEITVSNPRSGAYGIPQALPASRMASAGADWRTNPVTQITWGLGYIDVRYGSACNAWAHWIRNGWY
jgi:hypothetical protein